MKRRAPTKLAILIMILTGKFNIAIFSATMMRRAFNENIINIHTELS